MSFRASESIIVHGFQAFYYEVLRQKERALSLYFSKESSDPDIENESNVISKKETEIDASIVSIQKKIISAIENVHESMMLKSRLSTKLIDDAKYIMAILADEIFINLNWDGAKFWRFSLLEKQLFRTEIAGERFFQMMDDILQNFNQSHEEILFLYLISLSLGFKGKHRDSINATERISWYKDRLYSMFHTGNSKLFYPGRARLIASCYDYTSISDDESTIPDIKFWSWTVIAVVFIYMIASYFVWYDITGEIDEILNKISEQVRNGALI